MHAFYDPELSDNLGQLNEEQARHCLQVLRHKIGDTIELLDGLGSRYEAKILALSKRTCTYEVLKKESFPIQSPKLSIAIAPTKNISRYEWFLEKATEIGISEVYPILSRYSERKNIRLDRLNKILVAAMKQSKRYYLPKLHQAISFSNFLQHSKSNEFENSEKYIAYLGKKSEYLSNVYANKNVIVLVGPEGGFSEEEAAKAEENAFQSISLGDYRLRTETAGIAACHTIQLLNVSSK